MEMHFKYELDFETMTEFFIASPRVRHCRCKNEIAKCRWQHPQIDSACMNRLVVAVRAGSLASARGR